MKKSLAHLPQHKRRRLREMTKQMVAACPDAIEMIILYGSHARGDWVEDIQERQYYTYAYISDYDILVILRDRAASFDERFWENRLSPSLDSHRPQVDIIRHDIHYVNLLLGEKQYFFSDIKKEGILLYDSGNCKLARARQLSPAERQQFAREDFKHWFESASEFLIDFDNALNRESYNNAAFYLHQVTERLYTTVLLVHTRYKPPIHDIKKLGKKVEAQDVRFLRVFPHATEFEEHCFKLLKKAYVDARYKRSCTITHTELEYLAKRVRKLRTLVKKSCKEKIADFT